MEEKILTINLRKYLTNSSRWKRKGKAMRILRDILRKRTKSKKIIIDKKVSETIWKSKSPGKVRIKIVKLDNGNVRVEKI
jgi:ribosomal protein L31E